MKKPKILKNKLFLTILILWGISWVTQTTIGISNENNNDILLTNTWFIIDTITGFIIVSIAFVQALKEKCYAYSLLPLLGFILLGIAIYVASYLHV